MMKRLATVILAVLTVIPGTLVSSGCGGTRGKAQASLKKGDETVLIIEKDSKTLVAKTDRTFSSLYKQVSAGKTPDVKAFGRDTAKITSLTGKMRDEAAQAKAEYQKILPLKGVPDYVKYADLKIKVIETNLSGLDQLEEFLGQQEEKISAEPFDPVAFQIAVVQFSDSLKKLGKEAGKLQERAEDLKKEKKL